MNILIKEAADLIKKSKHIVAFTGAGISVESGIPPFRGPEGLWSKYDPQVLDLNYFYANPKESWVVIKEIFYDFFGNAKPNFAHIALAQLEEKGLLKEIITQNIDNLHQEAGSKTIHEFHGNSQSLVCTKCHIVLPASKVDLTNLPPKCESCKSLYKPDFVFFGEGIPQEAYNASIKAADKADLFILIGTTGEVMPANQIPVIAKQNGAKIIEINLEDSNYTHKITDIYLKGKASEIMQLLVNEISI